MRKSVKVLLYLLIILLLVFVLPGIFTGKIHFNTKTEIQKPLSSVFVTIGDPARLAHWMTGFEKIEHLKGMPFCEGSSYRLTMNLNGKRFKIIEEIEKITWKKHLVVKMRSENSDMLADLYFFYLDGRTVIEGSYTIEPNTFGMRILLPWLKPVIRHKVEAQLDQFREMIEQAQNNP